MSSSASKLLDQYQHLADQNKIKWDDAQFQLLSRLQLLANQLTSCNHWLYSWLIRLGLKQKPKGLYLWGGVGRGKTFLMDMFYDALPVKDKKRLHFHRFMESVHDGLSEHKGTENPLKIIADQMINDTRLLCFDEFYVSDITDAMLLGELLSALFERGMVLVATSNIPPDKLYHNGLQRERFLPAIDMLKAYCEVINVDNGRDYRLRNLKKAEIFHFPLDQQAEQNLQASFERLSTGEVRANHELLINHRPIRTVQRADGVAWFEFSDLCQTERSAADYIELSRLYHTILLAGVPVLDDHINDAVRRFIALVDELYERQVKLIMSTEVDLPYIYIGSSQVFAFQRTLSRLHEMQTRQYLGRPHLP